MEAAGFVKISDTIVSLVVLVLVMDDMSEVVGLRGNVVTVVMKWWEEVFKLEFVCDISVLEGLRPIQRRCYSCAGFGASDRTSWEGVVSQGAWCRLRVDPLKISFVLIYSRPC